MPTTLFLCLRNPSNQKSWLAHSTLTCAQNAFWGLYPDFAPRLLSWLSTVDNRNVKHVVEIPPLCPRAADVVLALDQSTSIIVNDDSHNNWYVSVLGFASSIVRAFPISPNLTQIGVLKFSDYAHVSFLLDRYSNRNDVVAAINALRIEFGNTNIAAALRTARSTLFSPRNGARPGFPKILILVTDGAATVDAHLTMWEAERAKADGIEIFTVGITSHIDERQLRRIATSPSQFYYCLLYTSPSPRD